jgi:glycosyltransferase involved in cell wall biosynthesis
MPRLAVVEFIASPAGSQNLWVHALTDPRFAAVEKHVLVPAGATTRLSDSDRRAASIGVHEFGGRVARAVHSVTRRLGAKRDPLTRSLAALDPGLVWFNLAGIGEIGWIDAATAWCRARRVPYWLIVQHVQEEFFFASDAHEARARVAAKGAARVLTVSQRNRESLAAAFAERMPNVEHAVNGMPKPFLDAASKVAAGEALRTSGTARFISPARFDPEFKGQHLLFEAFAGAEWHARDWHLSLVGGGPHEQLVRRLVGYYGVPPERVTISPHTSDMPGAFASSDVIVMPSLSEGSPFALVEGMACGRPAMGTPVGGIDELVRDGETGWLARSTEPGDVAAALDRCWLERASWPQFGRNASTLASRAYDLEPAHRLLLEQVLSDARAR